MRKAQPFPINRLVISALYVLMGFLSLGASSSRAEEFTIRVRDTNGNPVSNVRISGTNGFNEFGGRLTDSSGDFNFDEEELTGPSLIAFAKDSAALRFEPAELTIGPMQCPGRVCAVTAHNDSPGTTTLTWVVRGSNGRGIAGVPVTVSDAVARCETRVTDSAGVVVFAIYRTAGGCNDNNTTTSDNFTTITAQSPPGTAYVISDPANPKFARCAQNAISGFFVASGGPAPALSVGSAITYKITARSPQGSARSGVVFTGPELGMLPEALRTTGSTGSFFVSTTQLGIAPGASWSLAALGDYDVYPRQMTIHPQTRVSDEFRFTAFSNFRRSGAAVVEIREEDNTLLGGVAVSSPQLAACGDAPVTNGDGRALLGYKVVSQCNNADNDRRNDSASFIPGMLGCQFTDSFQTPFERCPGENTTVALRAYCGEPAPAQYLVSGRVFDQDAQPLEGASIIRDGVLAATTGSSGAYSVYVDEFTSPSFRAFSGTLIFDPQSIGIAEIDRHHENISFAAVGPLSPPGATPTPPTCPASSTYTISGRVTALDGSPLVGATISENNVPQTTTDALGHYSFTIDALDDVWVTVAAGNRRFDPAGRYFPDTQCNRIADFHEILEESYQLVGRVVDAVYQPLAGARISLVHGGQETITETDNDGYYLVTAPDEAQYVITASAPGHEFSPALYSGEGERNLTGLNFTSTVQPTPTPTAIPTPPNPGNTPLPQPSVSPTPAPGNPSPAPTSTPGAPAPSPTNNPGGPSPAPSATPTSAPVAPTATPTEPPRGTPPPTGTPGNPPPTPLPTGTPQPPAVTPPQAPTGTPRSPVATPPPAVSPTVPAGTPTPGSTPPPTASPTVPGGTPTPVGTTTPIASPTVPPTPPVGTTITLESVCSADPNTELRWSITNPGPVEVVLTWDVYGTVQQGTITAAVGTVYLTTLRGGGSNTLRLFEGDRMIAVRSASFEPCPATPTPIPSSTPTPEPTPTPVPPTPAPSPPSPPSTPPTVPPTPPPAPPTETPTPTISPTPISYQRISGRLTGPGGDSLSSSMLARLERLGNGAIKVLAINRHTRERFGQALDRPFRYTLTVPKGEYRFRLVAPDLVVISRGTYSLRLYTRGKTRANFAVRLRSR